MEKDEVTELLIQSIKGPKEIKQSEKNKFLGTFRERVVLALTQVQVRRKEVYPDIEQTIVKYPAVSMLLNGEMNYDYLSKYITLANRHNIPYRAYSDFDSDSDLGLVLALPEAADVDDIYVVEGTDIKPEPATNNKEERSILGRLFKRN